MSMEWVGLLGIFCYIINSCTAHLMECRTCLTTEMLVCSQCYTRLRIQADKYQAQAKYQQKKQQVQAKLKAMNMAAMINRNQIHRKKQQIRRIRERISQLRNQISQQKQYAGRLHDVKQFHESYLTVNQSQVQKLYLEDLLKKNRAIKTNILAEKKEKKIVLDKLAGVLGMEQKKYKIQKYFRFEDSKKNIIFTLENQNYGIPVIKANNEQVINYHPLEQDSQILHQQEQMLINTLKVSSKLLVLMHRIFISQLKLPYKMYCCRQFLYVGNSMVCFDSNLQLSSQHLLNIVNMVQANIEYIAFTVGAKQKPFLMLDRPFYEGFQKREFSLTSFKPKQRKWKSFLKALKPSQILQHHEEQLQAQLIVLSQYKKSQESDDEYFQLLQ